MVKATLAALALVLGACASDRSDQPATPELIRTDTALVWQTCWNYVESPRALRPMACNRGGPTVWILGTCWGFESDLHPLMCESGGPTVWLMGTPYPPPHVERQAARPLPATRSSGNNNTTCMCTSTDCPCDRWPQ